MNCCYNVSSTTLCKELRSQHYIFQFTCRIPVQPYLYIFRGKTICDSLEPNNCTEIKSLVPNNWMEIKALSHHKVLFQPLHNRMQQSIYASMTVGFLSKASYNMYDKLQYLPSDIHHLECQLEMLFLTTLFFAVAQQYSGSALSKFTAEGNAALTPGDVLKKTFCQPTTKILLPNLKYKKQYSSRRILQCFINSMAKIGKLWSDAFLYEKNLFHRKELT